jgi:hypothetical protein
MAPYKEAATFPVKDNGEDTTMTVDVYSHDIYNEDFYLEQDDLHAVLDMLFVRRDPTRGVDRKGHRYGIGSAEATQRAIQIIVWNYMRNNGEMFRDPQPTWFDRKRLKLCRLEKDNAWPVLFPIGFAEGLPNFTVTSKNIYRHAVNGHSDWPEKTVYPLAFMPRDSSAIYIRATEISMYRVTADRIEVVPIGTDDILLKGDKLGNLPPLEELNAHVEGLRPLLGHSTMQTVPGTPLTTYYLTRFSEEDVLSYNQAHTMVIARLMFMFCASRHPLLWPMRLLTGDTSGGKSTLAEIENIIFRGDMLKVELDALPTSMASFISHVTSVDYCCFDNIDNAFDEASDELKNMMCRLATGASISLRVLYETNTNRTYSLLKHVTLSARANPFDRDDILRRVLHIKMAPGAGDREKTGILEAALDNRTAIWAEILIRCQNIVKAHKANAGKSYPLVSKMKEYENYTMICADFEDSLEETRKLWAAYTQAYKDAITLDNHLLTSVLLWLGQNVGRAKGTYSSTSLHASLLLLHKEIGIEFPYKYATTFGKAITSNEVALRAGAGLQYKTNNKLGRREISFMATPEILAQAVALYHDVTGKGNTVVPVKRGPSIAELTGTSKTSQESD